ncbi:carboxymethylenebutenolidase [Acrasis kona]|uniref:Carboxymethylenebutenolidase n=1 Tax=Acrasis kona TaxID=1008807 RepID=A0AAW2YK83_9EUKA
MINLIMSDNKVDVRSENKKGAVHGYLSEEAKDNFGKTGLIVIQEWWGVNEQIKEKAQKLAKEGFVTIVPDLYRGKVAKDHEEAGHLMNDLDWVGAVQDIRGCAQYLKEHGCNKVGVTGFCMGGALAIAAVSNDYAPEIDASAPFYGIPDPKLADPSTIKVPVQGHFGNKDELKGFSAPEDVDKLEEKFKSGNVKYELFRYDGAGHAFTNWTGPNYNEKAANEATDRIIKFFKL